MIRALVLCLLTIPASALAQPISGYDFLQPETKALQDDDFANPGLLWVETGDRLWHEAPAGGQSCQDCHGDPEKMRGVGTHYPEWSESEGKIISLEQQINLCRRDRQKAEPFAYSSDELNGLVALVMTQSKGLPMHVVIDGKAAEAYANGKEYYGTRRGQLNLACTNCHVDHVGDRLRGDTISQGQVNGFPIYRLLWQDIGSVGRMIAWCNDAVRAEPLQEGSDQAVELELYLRARGDGLPIETPAVRR